ncbi:HNH endonuclease [uncultured Secundilactobacillus sp.]|nr:HNH endonuclease [uncultured Secundilactobacillus sp.]
MPKVHRCGQHGCRQMIPLGYRYCDQHYKQHYQNYLHSKETHQATRAYQYHRARQAKHYDDTIRFADDGADESTQDLAKSFGLKDSTKKAAQNIGSKMRAKFYRSKQWQSVRSAVYARDVGCCQVCGRAQARMYVDHVVPLSVCEPDQQLDLTNLWTLCGRCHNLKTKHEQKLSTDKMRRMNKQDWKEFIKF